MENSQRKDFDQIIDEIYESIRKSAKGKWEYDDVSMLLTIYMDDQNIIKVKIPNRDIGSFIAESPGWVAWLLESVYAHRDLALKLLPKELQDNYIELVRNRLNPEGVENAPEEKEEKKETPAKTG